MPSAKPLITSEELQCLLGGAPERSGLHNLRLRLGMHTAHWGAALWLLKGIVLFAVLMSPEAAHLAASSRYLGMRGGLELVCLAIFWLATLHPRGRTVARSTMLVASTTLLMDVMTLLAFTG